MVDRIRAAVRSARRNLRYADGSLVSLFLVLAALVLFVAMVMFCGGCTGAQFAVSLEADRKLTASARANAEVVLAGARAAGDKPTTVQLLEGCVASLGTLQAGPVGVAEPAPWPQSVRDTVAAEQRCEAVVVQDPAVVAALEQERRMREAYEADSRATHGKLQAVEGALKGAAAEAAAKYGLGTVATGGGGLLVALLAAAWRNRAKAQAIYAMVAAGQEIKHSNEEGKAVDVAEVIRRHAGANGAAKEIERTYQKVKAVKSPRRRRSVREVVTQSIWKKTRKR